MGRRKIIWRALAVIAVAWLLVFSVRTLAGSRKITAESVQSAVEKAKFADWSERENPSGAEARRRDRELERIAGLVNRLDFQEREKNRDNRSGDEFFAKLSKSEKIKFIDLTVAETMNRFMKALDAMPPDERKRFVEKGLDEIRKGRTQEDMERAQELDDELLERITAEGMRAYFEEANVDTKLDLAPLMESMNEVMQGLRGNDFGGSR